MLWRDWMFFSCAVNHRSQALGTKDAESFSSCVPGSGMKVEKWGGESFDPWVDALHDFSCDHEFKGTIRGANNPRLQIPNRSPKTHRQWTALSAETRWSRCLTCPPVLQVFPRPSHLNISHLLNTK